MKLRVLSALSMLAVGANAIAATSTFGSAPADPGVINQERIIYWMTKRGELPANATAEQKAAALKAYLSKKSFERPKLQGELADKIHAAEHLVPHTQFAHKNGANKGTKLRSQMIKNNNDVTVKVLTILVDFPDLKYNENRLSASDTAMYYDDYSVDHYDAMLFNRDGYEGPNGQTLETSHQFYQQVSGGTFFFTGKAYDWVTADKDAAEYGGNDPDDNDNDMAPRELVIEAVRKAVAENNIDLTEYDKTDFFDLDGDGNIFEPDGIIDHVMVFHSSVGEEAGGGVLGEDAIWSHRWFVGPDAVDIPDSDIKLHGYTINPIDAAIGVTVHEFGHDLGLPDLYDTDNGEISSPVGDWSVMASGSWNGSPAGSRPSHFSPYGREYLQNRYGGNWVNQHEVDFSNLESEVISLVEATNHNNGINQVKVNLPTIQGEFDIYQGSYALYSGDGHLKDNRASITLDLPAETATLSMKARWDIELDWDYVQVLVNGEVIEGSHTKKDNERYSNITNFITGQSKYIVGAEGDYGWVNLTFDLSAYAGQNATIEIAYITDRYTGGYGFVADNIEIKTAEQTLFSDGLEETSSIVLNGFFKQSDSIDMAPSHYYVQLRSQNGVDSDFVNSKFDDGILIWYRDTGVENNQVNKRPGRVFLGVVDADQNPIKSGSAIRNTGTQIRDAAFSQFDQSTFNGDEHLTAITTFDDKLDYSAPYQPASGIKLPTIGLKMSVDSQVSGSETATITLSRGNADTIETVRDGKAITLSLNSDSLVDGTDVVWNLGDGTQLTGQTVSHNYEANESFDITVSYQNGDGSAELTKSIKVSDAISGTINTQVTGKTVVFSADLTGGDGEYFYQWDIGDGSDVTGAANPSHDYEEFGQYPVVLRVMDNSHVVYKLTTVVTVAAAPLEATINHTVNNLRASFTTDVSGGDGSYSYQWDFGDGNTSTSANPSRTYSTAGTYTVTLIVTDGAGESVTTTTSVTVTAPVVTPPPTPTNNGGSGGGSLGIVSLFALLLLARRRQS